MGLIFATMRAFIFVSCGVAGSALVTASSHAWAKDHSPKLSKVQTSKSTKVTGLPHATSVTEAWIRIPPPGAPMVALYFTIANKAKAPFKVTGVKVFGAMASEIHETSIDGTGIASMRRIKSLEVPAGGVVTLKPGGLHVMIMGFPQQIQPGDDIAFEIESPGAPTVKLKALAKP